MTECLREGISEIDVVFFIFSLFLRSLSVSFSFPIDLSFLLAPGQPQSAKVAHRWFDLASKYEHAEALYHLGLLKFNAGIPRKCADASFFGIY